MIQEDAVKVAESFVQLKGKSYNSIGTVRKVPADMRSLSGFKGEGALWSIEFILAFAAKLTPRGFFVLVDDQTKEARFSKH